MMGNELADKKYPAGFAFASVQELSDLVDALSVAMEELDYRSTLEQDYDEDDRVAMLAKSARLNDPYKRFVIALNGACRAEARERPLPIGLVQP